jgi:hypothetical protein
MFALPAALFAFIPHQIAWLEEATAAECKANAWTEAKAAATKAWCIHNGYSVE